ncbi:MAG: hypothetical protein AB1510_07740 [Bacillota bacterium]
MLADLVKSTGWLIEPSEIPADLINKATKEEKEEFLRRYAEELTKRSIKALNGLNSCYYEELYGVTFVPCIEIDGTI